MTGHTNVHFHVQVGFEGTGLDEDYLSTEAQSWLRSCLEDRVGSDHALGFSVDPAPAPHPTDRTVEGVDNSPEAIEQIRQELVEHRNKALGMGEMRYSVLMSHVIVLLAELEGIKEEQAKWPQHIRGLVAQAKKDVADLNAERKE